MCSARVRDQDALQIHFIESCSAFDQRDSSEYNAASVRRNTENDEPTSDLVEVVFRWEDTKESTENSIYLISSLAGQIKLDRTESLEAFESAKIIVPCGIHECQLVVDEDCYPVIDIEVDDMADVVHIILQEDPRIDHEPTVYNGYPSRAAEERAPLELFNQRGRHSKAKGAMEQDEITMEYARRILDEVTKYENDADEVASVRSSDSNYEAGRMTRRKKQLEDLSIGQKNENVASLAKNGLHQVQVHTIVAKKIPGEDSQLVQHEMDRPAITDRRDSQGSLTDSKYEERRDSRGSNDVRKDSMGSIRRAKIVNRKDSKGSLADARSEAGSDYVIQPPNGFQSENDQKPRTEKKRTKHLTKIARSKGYLDSLADQQSPVKNEQGTLEKKRESERADVPVPHDERPSWGPDDVNVDKEETSVESMRTRALQEEASELIAKCEAYRDHLEKSKQDNECLVEEIRDLQEKTKDYRDMMMSKDEKIEEYQAKCESYETELKRMKAENQSIMKEYVNISNRNEAIAGQVADQEETIKKKSDEVETLERRLDILLQDNKVLKEENESLQTAHKLQQEDMDRIIQDEVSDLKSKLKSVEVGSRSFQYEEMKKMSDLERTIKRLKSENDQLKHQLQKIKHEADLNDYDEDGIDGSDHADYRASDRRFEDKKSKYLSRDLSPTEGSYGRLSKHERIYQSTRTRKPLVASDTRSRSYDDHDSRIQSMTSYDSNQNYLRDIDPLRFKIPQSRHSDGITTKGSSTGPLRASHFDYVSEVGSDLSKYRRREDSDYLSRERKPRRERPRSFHGGAPSENDSRELRRNLASREHEDLSTYSYDFSHEQRETRNQDDIKKFSKPFAPDSIDDISVGMRVLVTRKSGGTSKGIVKWKGHLEGHSGPYIGIELETPNGRHDGVYEKRRYFYCKKDHGIFSTFAKIVMVWGMM